MARRLTGSTQAAAPFHVINLTPMVPVLLAVFAVVAVAASTTHAALGLDASPQDFGPQSGVQVPTPYVSVDVGGGLRIEGRPVDVEHFGPALKQLSMARGKRVVLVRAEPDTSYGDYMKAVRLIRRQGLNIQPINEDVR
jgi:biopolymer transport protein ExbD